MGALGWVLSSSTRMRGGREDGGTRRNGRIGRKGGWKEAGRRSTSLLPPPFPSRSIHPSTSSTLSPASLLSSPPLHPVHPFFQPFSLFSTPSKLTPTSFSFAPPSAPFPSRRKRPSSLRRSHHHDGKPDGSRTKSSPHEANGSWVRRTFFHPSPPAQQRERRNVE